MFQPYRLFTQPVNRSRSDGLDALRFLLAFWVLLAHAVGWSVYIGALGAESFLNGAHRTLIWLFQRDGETHPAVLAFIVLSGYCIHRNGFRLQSGFNLAAFGIRRAFRILPVYFLASAIGVALYLVNAETNALVAKTLSGTENISAWCILIKLAGVSSFIPSLHTCSFQGNAPLTTAMVEIWLYLFYAVVAWRMATGGALQKVLIGAAVFWLITFGYVVSHPDHAGWWHNGSFISFALYWWIGAFCAEYGPGKRAQISGQDEGRIFVSIMWCSLLAILIGSLGGNLVMVELRKVGFAVVLGFAIRWLDRDWRSSVLAKAGQAGYDIYALHAPLMLFLLLNKIDLILAVGLTLAISMACHLIFERPLLEMGKRLATKNLQ